MSETLPRWGLDPVDFLTTDAANVEAAVLTKYEEITGRSLAAGDPVRLFLLSIAAIIAQQRSLINIAAQQNLLSYATGENLDALGLNLAVTRLPEAPAVTTLSFTLSEALAAPYAVPAGTEVTNGVVTFATDREVMIPAGELTVEVPATCTTAGEVGNNYLPGQITTIVKPMAYMASAANTTITEGGADVETDADYANRIRLAPNSFSVAGPTKAYEYHARTVSSAIVDVTVTSPEPGVVHVFPLLENGELPGEDVLTQVENYLSADDIRPLTDHVQALAPKAVEYAINVDYWISQDDVMRAQTIRENVEAAAHAYREWQHGRIGRDIAPGRLIAAVINAGASRIDSATMSPPAFVELADDEVAQCTSVTVTYRGYKDE